MINISELITDPDFAQPQGITFTRRSYSVVNHRPEVTETQMNVPGIITIGDMDSSTLLENGNKNEEVIHLYTLVPLLPVGQSNPMEVGFDEDEEPITQDKYLGDVVLFSGQSYQVTTCLNDGQYGFYHSSASKINPEVSVYE